MLAGLGGLAFLESFERARAQAPAPNLEDLFSPPSTADVALSPSGNRIALLRNARTAKGVRSWVELLDARDPAGPRKTLNLGDSECSGIEWAHETRVMVWVVYDVTRKGFPPETIRRIVTLADDGTHPAAMFGTRGTALEYIHDLGAVIDMLPDDPDYVLMQANEPQRGLPALFKVNVNTGVATVLEYGDARTVDWLTQDGVAMIRRDSDRHGSQIRVLARAPGETAWKFIGAYRTDQTHGFDILGPAEQPGVFFARARREQDDKASYMSVDLRALSYGDPLFTPDKVDADDVVFDRHRRRIAWRWREDRTVYAFADEAFRPHFSAMERRFGSEVSIELLQVSDDHTRWLAAAEGPTEPGHYFFYDTATRAVTELGRRQPDLSGDRLGRVEALSVRTRDGANVPGYLTRPASGAPGPLVVMPHGGPEARDYRTFDAWAQGMAARGWWVLQPNFRGSGGYGRAFARAGWRRWGDRMQEDIEDAVAQVLKDHGLAGRKVAICGGSYGGYAALMGAVRRPDLYCAVVAIAGVSDLPEMLRWVKEEDDTPEKDGLNFWAQRIGDPVADADMLATASPRRRAAEIRAPVLLMHGTWDATVPIEQSRMMAKALTEAGKAVELVEIKRADHAAYNRGADKARLAKVLDFLSLHLA